MNRHKGGGFTKPLSSQLKAKAATCKGESLYYLQNNYCKITKVFQLYDTLILAKHERFVNIFIEHVPLCALQNKNTRSNVLLILPQFKLRRIFGVLIVLGHPRFILAVDMAKFLFVLPRLWPCIV